VLILPWLRKTFETVTTDTFSPLAMSSIVTGMAGSISQHVNALLSRARNSRDRYIKVIDILAEDYRLL
jgi:hypothetical protein